MNEIPFLAADRFGIDGYFCFEVVKYFYDKEVLIIKYTVECEDSFW